MKMEMDVVSVTIQISYDSKCFNIGYRFGFTIPVRGDYIFCPPNTTRTDPTCQCGIGFERNGDKCGK